MTQDERERQKRCPGMCQGADGVLRCDHSSSCMGAQSLLPRVKRVVHADGSVTLVRQPPCCSGCVFGCYGSLKSWAGTLAEWRGAMGLPHFGVRQLALAIPPHYSRYIGGLLAMEMCKRDGIKWAEV